MSQLKRNDSKLHIQDEMITLCLQSNKSYNTESHIKQSWMMYARKHTTLCLNKVHTFIFATTFPNVNQFK